MKRPPADPPRRLHPPHGATPEEIDDYWAWKGVPPLPRRRVSSLWTLVPWVVPMRFLSTSIAANVERAVYDGLTRSEWFRQEIRRLHAAQMPSHTEEKER